ncbi:SAM-dependent methyltransferase [Streptoalloteichus hindustanus]|uniref:S-adenosyl methyltransferase n=1 Tax=Streptoalloteichus hindustanus TaxID=2017 RepID=A0A1M4UAM9_STRHI|nr:SAM-dependent methyltransferase [Streptoalloteichus hindustanus]SHE53785.1 S-adenosyl methyltransferase [Streptoalloteichus hindustanus]
MDRPDWAPGDIDLARPSAARVYDYYLGGSHNFAVDRELAAEAVQLWPDLPRIMRTNRAFLRRAVRYCLASGIRQFLDLGSGIPTVGNVHEVAQAVDPGCRVVYVDLDPVAVVHSRAILPREGRTAVVHGDLRDPDAVLAAPAVRELLDPDEPLALLMVAVLHFVQDADDPAAVVARYAEEMAPGSHLVLSHATHEGRPERAEPHQRLYARTRTPMRMRSHAEVAALLDGFELVEPGLVPLPRWRPEVGDAADDHPERFAGYAGVGRKP